MINQTIQALEFRIQNAQTLTTAQREELQTLVSNLRQEVQDLAKTHQEAADSILRFADVTTNEGLRGHKDPKLLAIAVDGIRASVERFEKTHPVLTRTVNDIATYFSNLGI